jgi:hypothetical protein
MTDGMGRDWVRRMPSFIDPNTAPEFDLFNLSVTGLQYMDDLSRERYDHAYENGARAVELAQLLAVRSHPPILCDRAHLTMNTGGTFTTIDFMMRQAFITLSGLTMENPATWGKSYTMCSAFGRMIGVSNALHGITGSISGLYAIEYQTIVDGTFTSSGLAEQFERVPPAETALLPRRTSFNFLIALTPAITLFMLFPPLILASVGWRKEQERQAATLLSFSPADREKAAEKIGQLGVTCKEAEGINAQAVEVGCPMWIASVVVAVLPEHRPFNSARSDRMVSMLHHYALFDALRSAVGRALPDHGFNEPIPGADHILECNCVTPASIDWCSRNCSFV